MRTVDVIIVGGGPAGSSCAWQLQRQGKQCLILEKESFPRSKLCAGWITPEVLSDLHINIDEYPHRFLSFDSLQLHFPWFDYSLQTVQHSIRRYEFDDWLLTRSGAEVIRHEVRSINTTEQGYEIDGLYRCRYLVGAGGTRCPVYRKLFKNSQSREKHHQAVTLEHEFACDYPDTDCHLWFFDNGLPGYAWYVPKQKGYINIGIGAMKQKLRGKSMDIHTQWSHFTDRLVSMGLSAAADIRPKGYSYYVRGKINTARMGNAFITGDALGLATRDMCEGIGPAVRSGLMAADSIINGEEYRPQLIPAYSGASLLARKLMEYKFHQGIFKRWAA